MRADVKPGAAVERDEPGVGYCRMVTITTSDPQETLNYRSGVNAEWPFLSDAGRIVQRDLDIAEYTDPAHDQMVPHTIFCASDLVIYKIYSGYLFFARPTVEELRMDLRAVLQQCHWDWDLSDPQVRAAWDLGHTDHLYPPELGWPQGRTSGPEGAPG